jgi:hypothetical protein
LNKNIPYDVKVQIDNNYWGFKTGDLVYIEPSRKEIGKFYIFSDGSATTEIYSTVDNKYSCQYGDLFYIFDRLHNGGFKGRIISDKLANAYKLYYGKLARDIKGGVLIG